MVFEAILFALGYLTEEIAVSLTYKILQKLLWLLCIKYELKEHVVKRIAEWNSVFLILYINTLKLRATSMQESFLSSF